MSSLVVIARWDKPTSCYRHRRFHPEIPEPKDGMKNFTNIWPARLRTIDQLKLFVSVLRCLGSASVLVFQFACSQLATIRNVTPTPPNVGTANATGLATKKEQQRDPSAALSRNLDVVARSWAELKRNPANAQAKQLYNYSVGRVVSLLQATAKLPRAGRQPCKDPENCNHACFNGHKPFAPILSCVQPFNSAFPFFRFHLGQ